MMQAPLDQTMNPTARADHLPRIELPRFTGSPTEWLAFKSRFEKRILTLHEDADKFAFLNKCLERYEPALNTMEALENSGVSFAEAWAKLEERFYKKRVAFEGYFSKLIRMKKANNPSAKAIMALIDALDTTVHAAKQITNETSGLDCVANGLIVSVVKSKLDDATLSKLEERLDIHKVYPWVEFKTELERRANQLACQPHDEGQNKPRQPTKTAALASTKVVDSRPCFGCSESGHTIYACPSYANLSVPQRKQLVSKEGRCFNCLGRGHTTKGCKSPHRCRECNGPHHSSLHEQRDPRPTGSNDKREPNKVTLEMAAGPSK
ncbi:uncharacterized protein LOC131682818 [Topomyia yanbarensis]|uniref:uncharacterized protein LOC131682818 n=1 Tax=Topomyia yanbarensis TaxID=2498891 RepID=UPI00273CC63C|nr:uncharacterized protein LOC131682818 [Topomyia yanbarensis]